MKNTIYYIKGENEMSSRVRNILKILSIFLLIAFPLISIGTSAYAQAQSRFDSAEKAASSLAAAMKAEDPQAIRSILGPDADEIISSGDKVADSDSRQKFLQLYDEQNQVVMEGEAKAVLEIGKKSWPFPIPVVKDKGGWFFDTKSGKEEILNRRIGRNEIETIQTLLAIVDAQREYAAKDYDNDGILEYAEKFKSDPGTKNGLYWESGEATQEESPLGPLIAKAKAEKYAEAEGGEDNPQPYHGYLFKMLKKQGANASGGAFDYVANSNMIGGFAVMSYPAEYGNSGVITFIISHDGVVYQKDLGPDTGKVAGQMDTFDPDVTWQEVGFYKTASSE